MRAFQDDANRKQVINFLKRLLLPLHLSEDRVDMLGPALNLKLKALFIQLLADRLHELFNKLFARILLLTKLPGDKLIGIRIDDLKAQILKLAFDIKQAEAVSQRCVELHCFRCDLQLLLARKVLDSAHIVQAVGKFDQYHPNIFGHREQQLHKGLGLLGIAAFKNA